MWGCFTTAESGGLRASKPAEAGWGTAETRRAAGESAFSIIGGSGNKTFTDESLPLGTDSVQYTVTAIRGSVNGIPSNSFTVQFGVGGEGFSVAKASVKLAA